jgi:uncharacterized coiled-coil DUF342 family protein
MSTAKERMESALAANHDRIQRMLAMVGEAKSQREALIQERDEIAKERDELRNELAVANGALEEAMNKLAEYAEAVNGTIDAAIGGASDQAQPAA